MWNLAATRETLLSIARLPLPAWGFLRAALRRSARLWCATAVLGIIIGYGLYGEFPPAYQATTSILVTNHPSQNPADAIASEHDPGERARPWRGRLYSS